MADIPEDLTDVGTHRGNEPPPETGQTVRSPTGPDPNATEAVPSPALFQLVRADDEDRLSLHLHSARAEVSAPETGTEIGRHRTVDALRDALEEEGVDGHAAVFKDTEADRVLVETDVTADHPWIGQPRYATIAFFETAEAATAFADAHERSRPDR